MSATLHQGRKFALADVCKNNQIITVNCYHTLFIIVNNGNNNRWPKQQ